MLGGKRDQGFNDKKRGEDRKSWIKPLLIVFSLEQVHEKPNLETPEMAKKPLLRPPSNVQLTSNLFRSTKALLRGWDDYIFLDQCPKYIVSAA